MCRFTWCSKIGPRTISKRHHIPNVLNPDAYLDAPLDARYVYTLNLPTFTDPDKLVLKLTQTIIESNYLPWFWVILMSSWRLLIVEQGSQLTCDLLLYVTQQSIDSNAPVLDLDLHWTSQSSKQEAPDVWCEM